MTDYYDKFKPIRNRLRKINLFYILDNIYKRKSIIKSGYVPEVYEFIYVNALLYCPLFSSRGVNQNRELSKIMRETNDLMNLINESELSPNDDPWRFLRIMWLNQERIKVSNISTQLFRYYTIYSEPKISKHIESAIGLSYFDFFMCAFWIYSIFSRGYNYHKCYFLSNEYTNWPFSPENIEMSISILSITYDRIKEKLKSDIKIDDDAFIFHAKQHNITPIIEYNDHLICLYDESILKQMTAGMYYVADIPNSGLNNEFGQGFERYIGIILQKLNVGSKYKIKPEIKYLKGTRKSTDWIIEDDETIVFLECKTRRQPVGQKRYSSANNSGLFAYAAGEITKIYKCYYDYKNNLIKDLKFTPSKTFIPLIVFLEDGWYVDVSNEIDKQVKVRLEGFGLDSSIVDSNPFKIYSCTDLEQKMQIMFEVGFNKFFDRSLSEEISAVTKSYKYQDYFSDDFIQLLDSTIKVQI